MKNNTVLPPTLYLEVLKGTETPTPTSSLTLKILLLTENNLITREYLPISPLNLSLLDNPPGLLWIPVKAGQPYGLEIHLLSIIDPLLFNPTIIQYNWTSSIYKEQFILPPSLNNYRAPHHRIWNMAEGRSRIINNMPIFSPTNNHPTIKQFCTLTIPVWAIEERALAILERNNNIYLRYKGNEQNKFFTQTLTPTNLGITVSYGDKKVYFARIKPLSGAKFRTIYKKLSSFKNPTDWIPLDGLHINILAHPILDSLHNRVQQLVH